MASISSPALVSAMRPAPVPKVLRPRRLSHASDGAPMRPVRPHENSTPSRRTHSLWARHVVPCPCIVRAPRCQLRQGCANEGGHAPLGASSEGIGQIMKTRRPQRCVDACVRIMERRVGPSPSTRSSGKTSGPLGQAVPTPPTITLEGRKANGCTQCFR